MPTDAELRALVNAMRSAARTPSAGPEVLNNFAFVLESLIRPQEPEQAARERLMLSARIDELQAIKVSGIIHPLQEMVDNRIEQLRAALKMARWGEASDAAERNRT